MPSNSAGSVSVLSFLLTAGGVTAGLTTLLGFGSRYHWILELTSHFRVQYAIGLSLAGGLLLLLGKKLRALCFLVLALVNAAVVSPAFLGGPAATSRATSPPIGALLINVYTANTEHAKVIDEIRRLDPDIVVLLEVDRKWTQALTPLFETYPHRVLTERADNFGIALLSRLEPERTETLALDRSRVPSILTEFRVGEGRFSLLATHPIPPKNSRDAHRRNEHLQAAADLFSKLDHPGVLLGDLNVTPWSYYFGQLLADGGLHDASNGRGILATWPAQFFPLRLPLDHFLHTRGIVVLDTQVGNEVGSDHYPVFVEFAIER